MIKQQQSIQLKAYSIIKRAVIEGTEYGYTRAHKHTDAPREEDITSSIVEYVMLALTDIINFED